MNDTTLLVLLALGVWFAAGFISTWIMGMNKENKDD